MSELAQRIALEVRRLSDPVLIGLVSCSDPDVADLAAREAARRMIAERPR
jgi:hypothetical protein